MENDKINEELEQILDEPVDREENNSEKINEEVVDTKILEVKSYGTLGVRVGAGKEVEKIVRLEKKDVSKSTS